MNKDETLKIMTMLSAFYGQGKSDPAVMVNAWQLILTDYDYRDAEQAVLRYAAQDVRDYATFPAPGVIIAQIDEMKAERHNSLNRAWNELYQIGSGTNYADLSADTQALCSEEAFLMLRNVPFETRHTYRDQFIEKKQKMLEEDKHE